MTMSDAEQDYNAVVIEARYIHDALMILRVRPDSGIPTFLPGQYTTLGLPVHSRVSRFDQSDRLSQRTSNTDRRTRK